MQPSLISAAQLQAKLAKATIVIDCRCSATDKTLGLTLYRQGHIPGAFYVDLERDIAAPAHPNNSHDSLPDFAQLQQTWQSFGISPYTSVVFYDDSHMPYAARAWWLLRYMGHEDVHILDGGFNAWVDNRGAIDRREPAFKQGSFTINLAAQPPIDRQTLMQKLK